MKFTFHVVGLPHTQTTKDYNACAYTQKTRKFCNMMSSLGHEVILYAGDQNEAEVSELVTCMTKEEQQGYLSEYEWFRNGAIYKMPYDESHILWKLFNYRVKKAIERRYRPGHFICTLTGKTQEEVYKAFPYAVIEYGVGYTGFISNYLVFESHAWMHYMSGRRNLQSNRPLIDVIPNYFETEDFSYVEKKKDYFLFMSRPIPQKGIDIAVEMAKKLKTKLVIAGPHRVDIPGVQWVGYADTKKRAKLMGDARALLCPTLYIEPFGGVVVEAQLCGTPVITSDWGVFPENVKEGVTGYRCHSIDEFVDAGNKVHLLSSRDCREFAMQYSVENVRYQYQAYFERMYKMWKSLRMI